MTTLAEFAAERAGVEQIRHSLSKPSTPKGFEPGVTWTGESGIGVSKPRRETPQEVDHAELLREWKFDPERYMIDGPLEYRQWEMAIGEGQIETMHYYKAKIVPIPEDRDGPNIDALIQLVRKQKRPKAKALPTGDNGFVVCFSDWQLGKSGELNGGTPGTVERVLKMIDTVEARVKELRKIGRSLGSLYILGLGDIVERCDGFYPNQTYNTDLTEAEQEELGVDLIVKAIQRWAGLFEEIVVGFVVGNHGQNRRNGKIFTDGVKDNMDASVFRYAAKVLHANQDLYGHVRFVTPDDRSTLLLDVKGTNIGLVHGHQFTGGGKLVQAKGLEWWKGQTFGLQPVAGAEILVSGHFHHYSVIEHGARVHFQTPTLDPGSRWVAESGGFESPTGTLTFVVGPEGYSDVQVLR